MDFDGEFKWLINPHPEPYTFTYDSKHYTVPAMSRMLFPREIAEHGEKRSRLLTDPEIVDGVVLRAGNDVMQLCTTSSAQALEQVRQAEPVILEKSRDVVKDPELLKVNLGRKLRPSDTRPDHVPMMSEPPTLEKGKSHAASTRRPAPSEDL